MEEFVRNAYLWSNLIHELRPNQKIFLHFGRKHIVSSISYLKAWIKAMSREGKCHQKVEPDEGYSRSKVFCGNCKLPLLILGRSAETLLINILLV